jgi:hypothetical protein
LDIYDVLHVQLNIDLDLLSIGFSPEKIITIRKKRGEEN